MKKNTILLLCIILIQTSLFAQSTKITDQNIGDIHIKQSINKLKTHIGWIIKQNSKMVNGNKETTYTVWENGKMIFEITPELNRKIMKYTDKIDQITTYSPKYKTLKGLTVGSSLENVLTKYPNCSIVRTPKGNFVIQSVDEYLTFIIDPKSYIGSKDKLTNRGFSREDFNSAAKIIAINIFDVKEETNI